jgi:hypothetical protein
MRWHVSEQSIYDENGEQIIEASEWYMRADLQKICNEHNSYLEKTNKSLAEYVKDQFIKIEDARTAICEVWNHKCKNCPLSQEDKCGDIKNLGIFNTKTMKLESLE